MDSTAKPAPATDDLLLAGENQSNGDYERVVREELARVQERLAKLAPVGTAAATPPEVKVAPDGIAASGSNANKLDSTITAFRAADLHAVEVGGAPHSSKRGVARILVALLLAGATVGAGAAWAAYGETIKPMVASFEPQIGQVWSNLSGRFGLSTGQGTAPTQTAAADTAAADTATPSPSAAPQDAASPTAAAAPASPDVKQMLQSMARDIASLQQGIDELKAGQEQMTRDNAKLAEQLKASQEQLTRVARISEQGLHPRPPVKPAMVAAAHRPPPLPPVSTLPPPRTIAPPAQAEATPLPGGPRPPKPVP